MAKTAASSQAKNIGNKKPRVDYSLSTYQLPIGSLLLSSSSTPRLPNEMMVQVFGVIAESGSLGLESLLAARSVCHQWNSLINSSKLLSTKFPLLTVDRLVVTFDDQQKCYELRWCNYESHKSRILLFSPKQVKCNRLQLCFAFNRLDIRRIVFQSLPSGSFNDDLVRFLCRLFSYCRHFKPKGLSIKNVSLKKLSAAGLYSLMAMCGKTLETFQACKLSGLKPDSITDAHLSLLN
uniref:F-box domain-containing protein n=1 Tax=Ditylenchus dipsaci TaxID=166011 RepID=A0A915D3X2_9BILA